VFILASEVAL